jgi:dCMP deaminase
VTTPTITDDVYTSKVPMIPALLKMCKLWAQLRSKDPNTKVGAVVYDDKSGAAFYGYNGFNKGMPDYKAIWDNRDPKSPSSKYNHVRHAEANAITKALQCLRDLSGTVLVVTHLPCIACMKDWIVPSGITAVYYELDHYADPLVWAMAERHLVQITKIEGVP